MENKKLKEIMVFGVLIIPFIFLAMMWNKLPAIVSTHFDMSGKADGTGSKSELAMMLGILMGVGALISLLIKNLAKIDPKKAKGMSESSLFKLRVLISVFMCAMGCVTVYLSGNGNMLDTSIEMLLVAVLFTCLGNYMNNIKPNYFIGVRTPWTLENEEVWRITHRFASKLWFFGGLILIPVSLLIPVEYLSSIFLTCILTIAIIPMIYSYIVYKKIEKS